MFAGSGSLNQRGFLGDDGLLARGFFGVLGDFLKVVDLHLEMDHSWLEI